MKKPYYKLILVAIFIFVIFISFMSIYDVLEIPKYSQSLISSLQSVSPSEEFLQELEKHLDYKTTGLNFQPSHPSTFLYNTPVLEQLNKVFPYDPKLPIPKQVWQMWKVGLKDEEFPDEFKVFRGSWISLSPEYKHYLKTNAECDALVAELYAEVPDVVHAYNIMPKTILKCDFSRYLLLFAYGGIYADIDTIMLKPIKDWFSNKPSYLNKTLDLGLVVGIESDLEDYVGKYARRVQINTWTIMAKKAHPMLAELISEITAHTLWREENGQLDAVLFRDYRDDVLNWTGPGIFTDRWFKYVNRIVQGASDNYETLMSYDFFDKFQLPITLYDMMVLPVKCMHPGIKHLNSGSLNDPLAYIQHMSKGVWKHE